MSLIISNQSCFHGQATVENSKWGIFESMTFVLHQQNKQHQASNNHAENNIFFIFWWNVLKIFLEQPHPKSLSSQRGTFSPSLLGEGVGDEVIIQAIFIPIRAKQTLQHITRQT